MSVTRCELLPTGMNMSVDGKRSRTYVHEWLVTVSSKTDMMLTVLAGALSASPDPIPRMWDFYNMSPGTAGPEIDEESFLQDVKVARFPDKEDNHFYWKITGTWKPLEPGQKDNREENPMNRPVLYHMEWAQFSKKVTRDVEDDRLIVNSAGDLYEDIDVDDARPVLVAVKNFATLDEVIALSINYKNAVNNDTFYGATAGCAKVESIVCGPKTVEGEYEYYSVTIRVQFCLAEETWDKVLVNKGNQAYDVPKTTPGATKTRVKNRRTGEFIDEAYLNYDGTQREDSLDPLPIPADGDPAFKIYPRRTFSGLGIGGA